MGAMPTTRVGEPRSSATWSHVMLTSVGTAHELTMRAENDPPGEPVEEKSAPMDSTGGPFGQSANSCKMMSRWSQQPAGVARLQAALDVDPPP